ncbi:uncharacterized protein LOC112462900, partial [Temnothorax curvispinosus]|uniref:Uncharacterized protein LOC112462900 n=1 Tax=Temnothorax curvispinosus TaxID=300111 RepID=A0A6J1QQH6_9HYME
KLQDRFDTQSRTTASLEERCASLKSTIEQLKLSLEKASATESELKSEINLLRHNVMEITTSSQSNNEKLKQLQKQLSNAENELANNEVQRSALESQLRLSTWPPEDGAAKDEELLRQLQTVQRERSEMRGKVAALNDKVRCFVDKCCKRVCS